MQTPEASHELATLDRLANIALMRRFYEARLANDVEGCLACFSPEVVLEIVDSTGLFLFQGRQAGKDAMRRSIEANQTEMELLGIDVTDTLVEGERIAVRRFLRMRGRGSGALRKVEMFEFARVVEGQIVELFQHLDTSAVALATGKQSQRSV